MTSCAVTMCTRGSRVATLLGILATLKLFTSTNGEWKPCVPTMYICPSVLPSVCISIRRSFRPYVCLSVSPFVCIFVCQSFLSYVYLSVSPFVCLFVRQSVRMSICPSVRMSVFLSSFQQCIHYHDNSECYPLQSVCTCTNELHQFSASSEVMIIK